MTDTLCLILSWILSVWYCPTIRGLGDLGVEDFWKRYDPEILAMSSLPAWPIPQIYTHHLLIDSIKSETIKTSRCCCPSEVSDPETLRHVASQHYLEMQFLFQSLFQLLDAVTHASIAPWKSHAVRDFLIASHVRVSQTNLVCTTLSSWSTGNINNESIIV